MVIKPIFINTVPNSTNTHFFVCPACGYAHCFNAAAQGWNGDTLRPTFTQPFVLRNAVFKCYADITNGRISFTTGSTHASIHQTLDLPAIT